MRGDVVTNKMMCGINGCQQVTITHVAGGDLQADFTPKDNNGLKAAFSLMCQTSQGEWEYLLVDEGTIMLIDGQEVLVKRK